MKSALLVGSSYSALPILLCLKRRGFYVAVCGMHESDPCHAYADESFFIDYFKSNKVGQVLFDRDFDYLVPSCNDTSYNTCSELSEKHGFPGYDSFETTNALHTKEQFRGVCANFDLSAPKLIASGTSVNHPEGIPNQVLPVLVKPVDSFSGRGVTIVNHLDQLEAAISVAITESHQGHYIAEQFCEGSLHSHSAFIENGEIFWDCFVDEFCEVYPYQVDCSNHPSRLPASIRASVRAQMMRVIEGMSLVDGLLHTQFIYDGERCWIVETMRRAPGDLYGQLIERSTGVNYFDLYVQKFVGETYHVSDEYDQEKCIARHTISTAHTLLSGGFSYSGDCNEFSFVPLKNAGETLEPAPFDKQGIAFLEYVSEESLFLRSQQLANEFQASDWLTFYNTNGKTLKRGKTDD